MVRANELRKGNWVNYEGINYFVTQIMLTELEAVKTVENIDSYRTCKYDEVHPITLTAEILHKCGLIKQERFHYSNVFCSENGNFIINQLRDSCEVSYGLDGNLAIIWKGDLFLHELQNLYFAVTVQELDITL
jgi:hypothetical protein